MKTLRKYSVHLCFKQVINVIQHVLCANILEEEKSRVQVFIVHMCLALWIYTADVLQLCLLGSGSGPGGSGNLSIHRLWLWNLFGLCGFCFRVKRHEGISRCWGKTRGISWNILISSLAWRMLLETNPKCFVKKQTNWVEQWRKKMEVDFGQAHNTSVLAH